MLVGQEIGLKICVIEVAVSGLMQLSVDQTVSRSVVLLYVIECVACL
jgi:hypothetical protein